MMDHDEAHQLLALAVAMRQKALRATPHMKKVYLALAEKCEIKLYGLSLNTAPDTQPPIVSDAPMN